MSDEDVDLVDDVEAKPRYTQSLPVLNAMAGYIIGRNGDHARYVRNSTGCHLHVDQQDSAKHRHMGHEWCYVRLHGSTHEIDQAKKLLMLRILDFRHQADTI